MPRQMPTTLRPRFRAQARGGGLLRHAPNRPPRFPTSPPPPGPSARPSGFSIRSQQDSIGFNPTAFMAPVRTSVATEFNSGEHRYFTKFYATSARRYGRSARQLDQTVACGTPPADALRALVGTAPEPSIGGNPPTGTLRGVSRRSPKPSGLGVATASALPTTSCA
jgi:hypothetical protein